MHVPKYVYGCIAPTFTAFHDDGTLDDDGQRRLLDFMLQQGGVDTFFIRSGMGQMYTFNMAEAKQIAKTACAHLKGRAPAIIGCSGVWDRDYANRPDPDTFAQQAIELSRFAQDCGADGVVHTMPEALVPKEGESIADMTQRYFENICASVTIPVLLYQPPGTLPEYCITAKAIGRLADIDNLVGMKVSSADGAYVFDLIRAVKNREFGFIVGCELVFYAGVAAGSRACIGQGTSLNPKVVRAILDRFLANDLEGAMKAQEDTNELCYICPNPVDFLKMYATENGYPVGLFARSLGKNPYLSDRASLAQPAYDAFKPRFEEILAQYA